MDQQDLTIPALADQMGINRTYLFRVLNDKQEIGRKFIQGLLQAFPDKTMSELFFLKEGGDKKITVKPTGTDIN